MKRPIKHAPARAPDAIQFARDQRTTANEFTQTVWQWIRNRQICGQKFRREFPVPPYTVDFCCVELKLVLEIDGADHVTAEGHERDRVRDEILARQGILVGGFLAMTYSANQSGF
jgi:very-short-patch-repair endonuclease